MMKKIFLKKMACMLMLAFGTTIAHASPVSILDQGGWFESGYVTWQKVAGLEYNVYVKESAASEWTLLDDELVREYPTYGRADALGLKAGSYQFKVVPVSNGDEVTADAQTSSVIDVKAHDRSGFAHKQAGNEGIGAYNNDGTLKENARVVYVWADNAKTVSLDVAKNVKGETVNYTGLQQIIYGYQKGDANGAYEKRPLCIRIIGTIKDSDMDAFGSSGEGLQIKGQKAYGKMNITIEGVGNDAAIWGFGILIRNCGMVELRNFGIYLCIDDCVSIDTKNEMIWVHNVDFFYGNTGGDADQAKGDGALDFKGDTQYCTFSYNHFFDTGKSNLGGLSETGDNYITLHHNWYDHSDSRHPRIRRMSMHIYNNYFDGNSKYGVGMTTGGSAFVERNYFRNCKYPMLISMQGSDIRYGKGTFSSEDGGIIKSFGNTIINPAQYVTYQQDQTEFDAWEAPSRDAQVPPAVKCKQGATSYNNFDIDNNIMYSYTPDEADNIPSILKGQYGAGRMQHGDFKWTFNNSIQDVNYGVIAELKSALQNYESTLVGFFDGTTIKNGGAAQTVDAGDGKGLTEEQQNSYVPSWAGGSGGVVGAGLSDPTFCGAEQTEGKKDYNFLWFNATDKDKIDAAITNGLLTYTEGVSFNATRVLGNNEVSSKYTGSLQIPQNGSSTFKCVNGVSSVAANIFRTGDAKGEIQVSKDGQSFTKLVAYSERSGDKSISATTSDYKEGPVYIRITNGASGSLHITGIKILYPDPNGEQPVDDIDDPIVDDTTTDASFEFELNGSSLAFINGTYNDMLEFSDPTTTMTVKATANAEGATIISVTGATAADEGTYTFDAPAAGESVTVTFSTLAANGTITKTYIINISRDIDPASIPVETGNIMLQSDNIPDGYKVDGSSTVKAYTYNSDLCTGAKLFMASAAQHTVTLPANAKITKIVMYGVVDNNSTKTAGKITELAGQTFDVSLPSRKTGTAFATATVDNVEITGSFTYTVGYAAGVKFALTVEQNDGGGTTPGGGDNPQPQGMEKAYIATTSDSGFDYYWFNAESETEVNGWLSDGTITLTNGTGTGDGQAKSSFKKDVQPTINAGQETEQKSEKIGTIEIAKAGSKGGTDGGTITFYCSKGVETFKAYMFRTGTYNFHVYKSTDGNSFTEIAKDETTGKGKLDVDYSSILKTTSPVWVRIQNTSTGGLNIQGVEITYLEPTGIQSITDDKSPVKAGVMYDLQGRRIVTPAKGQLYIMDGKKFVNK